ncbi:hypothetical protein DsansV1_C08g0083391 [Dioscorea sansibarensis]
MTGVLCFLIPSNEFHDDDDALVMATSPADNHQSPTHHSCIPFLFFRLFFRPSLSSVPLKQRGFHLLFLFQSFPFQILLNRSMEVEEESEDVAYQRSLFTRDHRPRLLYITGTSFITIARKAVQRAEEFNGPLGNLTKTLASVISPIINPLEHHCLLILSSLDDRILATEDITMQVFPLSVHLFTKFDELAILLSSLPEKFDQVLDQIIMLIHKLPLIDWTLDHLTHVLQTLTSTVEKLIPELQFSTSQTANYNSSQERDIMVDINFDDHRNVDESKKLSEEESVEDARHAQKVEEDIREVEKTCNEIIAALERMGKVEEDSSANVRGPPPPPPLPPKFKLFVGNRVKKTRKHAKDNAEVKDDPILELFDEGWLKR